MKGNKRISIIIGLIILGAAFGFAAAFFVLRSGGKEGSGISGLPGEGSEAALIEEDSGSEVKEAPEGVEGALEETEQGIEEAHTGVKTTQNGEAEEGEKELQSDEAGEEAPETEKSSDFSESADSGFEEEAEIKSEEDQGGNIAEVDIPESEITGTKFSFNTSSLDNKPVSDAVFSDYDITIVHVWGTFCGPCIAEMGDYAELYRELPDNVNLVGVICDVFENYEENAAAAREILAAAGAEFTNLRTSEDTYELTGTFQYVPSSFFVDRNGVVIGKMMDGGGFGDTIARLQKYLKE